MLEYYNDNTAIALELLILSGGYTVTGRTPTVLIRDKDTGNYFDFASRTFTNVATSATALLASQFADGLYSYNWDISGLFSSASGSHLIFEYHDATSAAIEHALVSPKLRLNVAGGGPIGDVIIKGRWTKEQKDKLFKALEDIKKRIDSVGSRTLILLRRLLGKKTLQKEDIQFIADIRRTDLTMWKEVLEIFKLNDTATDKELVATIKEFLANEEGAKKELIELLDKRIKKEPTQVVDDEDDNGDDE